MLTDISLSAIEYLALHLRECDREEIYNLLDHDSPLMLAYQVFGAIRNKGRGRIAWHQGRPAAWIGLIEERPGVFQVTMGGTDDLPKVAFECMRWMRENIPDMTKPPLNGWRLHCDARCGPAHEEQHKFLRTLGAREEGPPRMIGKDRGLYQTYVWLYGENGALVGDRAKVGQ
jgi:hypothetical protein